MFTLLLVGHALAAEARLAWRGDIGRLEIQAPGEHVAPDAPVAVRVGAFEATTRGDLGALRFPVVGGPVDVELRLALCADTSTSCRPVTFRGAGTVSGKRGTVRLAEAGAAPGAEAPAGGPVAEVASAAVAAPAPAPAPAPPGAATSGVVKVLDFTAVWCPPCNLMGAEVLHDPAATAGLPIEPVDVDRATAWPLKDRYAVGGYPTLVAVTDSGQEVDRLVGYPGPAETRAWFASLRAAVPLETLAAGVSTGEGPWGALEGPEAAAAARRLAEAGRRAEALRALGRAADGVDLRVARLLVEPSEADARWLFEHDAPPGDWVFTALDAAPALWPQAVALAPTVPPVRGADFLYVAAEHAPPEVAPSLRLASLALLRSALTGDPDKDRGHATFHATLLVETGDLDAAVALLDAHAARWPDEFTFAHAAARHLLDAKRLPEAETRARAALARAWGDQRLRAAATLAKVLAARGQRPEALRVLDDALREVPPPPPDIEVRTTRYRKELEALRAEIGN